MCVPVVVALQKISHVSRGVAHRMELERADRVTVMLRETCMVHVRGLQVLFDTCLVWYDAHIGLLRGKTTRPLSPRPWRANVLLVFDTILSLFAIMMVNKLFLCALVCIFDRYYTNNKRKMKEIFKCQNCLTNSGEFESASPRGLLQPSHDGTEQHCEHHKRDKRAKVLQESVYLSGPRVTGKRNAARLGCNLGC